MRLNLVPRDQHPKYFVVYYETKIDIGDAKLKYTFLAYQDILLLYSSLLLFFSTRSSTEHKYLLLRSKQPYSRSSKTQLFNYIAASIGYNTIHQRTGVVESSSIIKLNATQRPTNENTALYIYYWKQ